MFDTRRSEIEIIWEILRLSQEGARVTEILYQGNFSYQQLQNYLSLLLDKNILEEKIVKNDNGKFYSIYQATDKGSHLLDDITKLLMYFE